MPHLYDQIEALPAWRQCPECRRGHRDLAQIALLFGVRLFLLGGLVGWGLRAVLR